jgi:hypothetical protein
MDYTLAPIILPMLKQLRDTKQGSAMVDNEDLPEHLHMVNKTRNETQQFDLFADDAYDSDVWALYKPRWNWVLDEMIWAFEQIVADDWESQYWSVKPKLDWDAP